MKVLRQPERNTASTGLYGSQLAWWVHHFICLSSYPDAPISCFRCLLQANKRVEDLNTDNKVLVCYTCERPSPLFGSPGKNAFICKYSLYCFCELMLLDGIYGTFIYIAFELDVLQMCWCILIMCPIDMRDTLISSPWSISSCQNHVLMFPLFLLSLSLTGKCKLIMRATCIRPLLFM